MDGKDELAQLAEEFNQLTGRLQTTEEVRRRFVSDASHELKTPLASIRLLTDSILQDEAIDPATTREFVGDIGEAADRLIHISQELLELNRLDEDRKRRRGAGGPEGAHGEAVPPAGPLAESAQVTLETDLAEDCIARCDSEDANQILRNLMENAIKYNVPGGHVLVTSRRQGEKVCLSVADTGVGIPPGGHAPDLRTVLPGGQGPVPPPEAPDWACPSCGTPSATMGARSLWPPRPEAGVIFTVTLPAWREEERE